MNLEINDASLWSETVFGKADLGDKRLNNRLVQITKQLAGNTGVSLSKSCDGNDAQLEGGYRFLRNDRVNVSDIAAAGYETTAYLAEDSELLLALEDSTSLVYSHSASSELGYTSNKVDAKSRGYLVHSTMLLDANTEKTIGLVAQNRWCRAKEGYGKKASRAKRPYTEKESYKWEKNSHELANRLDGKIKDTISVCDREADVFEYIQYKVEHEQRFIVRASQDRLLAIEDRLFKHISEQPSLGSYEIEIAQKAQRKKRNALLELRATKVTFRPPKRKNGENEALTPITLNIVSAKEVTDNQEEKFEWILLTTEDINTFAQARKITRYYELRWRIEDFHKSWKSGTKVESLRMQSANNLEKMIVILSFVAVRLLQLKEHFEQEQLDAQIDDDQENCTKILGDLEWKVLWQTSEKKQLPKKIPSAAWAFKAIAKLGGWTNSKRTGKASWATIWDGWFRLNERVKGFLLAQELMAANL